MLFCDVVGFSYLSDLFPVEQVADVVNAFLEVCSTTIAKHGGVVAKYVGDFRLKGFGHSCPVFSLDDPLLDEFKGHEDLIDEMQKACGI